MYRLLSDRACSFHSDRAEAVHRTVSRWLAALSNRDLDRYFLALADRHWKLVPVYLAVENRSLVVVRLFH